MRESLVTAPLLARFPEPDSRKTADSIDHWRDIMWESFAELDFSAAESPSFAAKLWDAKVADSGIVAIDGSSLTARRDPEIALGASSRSTVVIWQLSGTAAATQEGRRAVVRPGDFVFLDLAREYEVDCLTPFEQIVFTVPTDRVVTHARVTDRQTELFGTTLRPTALSAPWVSYLRELTKSVFQHPTVDFAPHESALLDAFVSVFAESMTHVDEVVDDDHELRQVIEAIVARAGDPDLTAERVARDLYISRRTLFRVLASAGASYHQVLLSARLDKASALLTDHLDEHSIVEVALDCGFRSTSHFHASFRARHGLTPAQFRHLAAAGLR